MSTNAAIQTNPVPDASTRASIAPFGVADDTKAMALEREQLTDRLRSLRRVLPVLAQEMAAARRQASHLRVDNRRLSEQVRELRTQLEARGAREAQ